MILEVLLFTEVGMKRKTKTSKFVLLMVFLFLFLVPYCSTDELSLEGERAKRMDVIRSGLRARVEIIEKHWGIDMGHLRHLMVEFDVLPDEPYRRLGRYIHTRDAIVLDWSFLDEDISPEEFSVDMLPFSVEHERNTPREILDHELGHAYANLVSKRLGRGAWPNDARWETMGPREKAAFKIVSEGIGMYFALFSFPEVGEEVAGAEWPLDLTWIVTVPNSRNLILGETAPGSLYRQGYWLVRPILDKDLKRGVEYLVTHPFFIHGNDFPGSAKKYQHEALRALDPPPSS